MITDGQVKELRRLLGIGKTLATAARMTEMSENTARQYRDDQRLPSERKTERNYRTRRDPFEDVWRNVEKQLAEEPNLKAITLFQWLQDEFPGQFPDSTRRTFERRVAKWRAIAGPDKPVFFSQVHQPGRVAASDFTVCNDLHVKIAGQQFDHRLFHCVLTYSNIESVNLCFSESFEALADGIQKAFWEFGGVPQKHRSDSLSAAVRNHSSQKQLTERYVALMDHYRCKAERINVRCANENGDVESSHGHLKDRIDQALLLRGSRDFPSREDYMQFVEAVVARGNSNRADRFNEERHALSPLPEDRLDTNDRVYGIRVSKGSTINVRYNTYSVPSRLIGKKVDAWLSADQITVYYQDVQVQIMPRLVGKNRVSINYRHIIDSLVRKPGALSRYQYREEMFPTTYFRIAYDTLKQTRSEQEADRCYVKILELAAKESQTAVDDALRHLIGASQRIDVQSVRELITQQTAIPAVTDVQVDPPDLGLFDSLLSSHDKECPSDEQVLEYHQTKTHTDEGFIERSPDQLGGASDGPTQGASSTDYPGTVRSFSDPRDNGEPESLGVSIGVGDVGMRDASSEPNQTADESEQTSAWQDLGVVRSGSLATYGSASVGDTSGRHVFAASGKCSDFRETRFREKPCALCVGRATDSSRSQHTVYDLQLAGSATTDCQARPATAAADQDTLKLRGLDRRRPGLRPARPRGDGSVVHPLSGTLRARQRVVDEQPSVQQMGPDIQGCNDDCGGHRSPGSSQCDHRNERAQLSSGGSQKDNKEQNVKLNSNCR